MSEKNIKNSFPNLDCKFVELHGFVDYHNVPTGEYFACCINRKLTRGCYSIDIVLDSNPAFFEVTCKDCKFYESVRQLSLFDYETE